MIITKRDISPTELESIYDDFRRIEILDGIPWRKTERYQYILEDILHSIPNAAIDPCRGGFYQGARPQTGCRPSRACKRRENSPMCEYIVAFGIEGSIMALLSGTFRG